MADYDTTVGVALEDDFGDLEREMDAVIQKMNNLRNVMRATLNVAKQLSDVFKSMNVGSSFGSSMNNMKKQMRQFQDELKKMNSQTINPVSSSNKKNALMLSNYQNTNTGNKKNEAVSYINSLKQNTGPINADYSVVSEKAKRSLSSYVESVRRGLSDIDKQSSKTRKSISDIFSLGKIYFFFNYTKQMFRGLGNIIQKALDFTEVENYFSRAMGNMYNSADKFQEKLSEMYGLSKTTMMQAQATYKNMIGSLGGLSDEVAYNLSETVTKMTLDFSSLYNVDFDKTVQKFQSALSKQVRPIRSVSGYDITQSVLAGTAQSLGIDRSISQMNELEKRLLVILTLMQQMRNSGAMNDFARTIEQPANQLRILQEQLQEVGRWLGSVFYGIIGGILPYINGFVMALKEVIKMLALFVGYEIPNSSGETGTILDSYGDSMDDFNSGLSDAGNAIDKNKKKAKEWKNVLMGFDVANVLPDQSSSDTSGGSSGGGIGGMSVDPKILDALNKYKYLFDDIHMKAQDIRDELLNWANIAKQSFKENIFQPIKNSWDKYGSGITDNLKGTFENVKYLVSDSARVIGENWKPMFQEISNYNLSMIDTVTLSMRSLTDCFVIAWDNGGNYLLENLMKFVKSCAELGTSLLDNFAKPLIDMFSSTIGKFVFTVIGKLLGAVGGLLKILSDLFGIISKNRALVSTLGGVFLALYSSIKIGQFVALVKMFGGVGEAIGMIASKIPILSTLLKGLFTTTSNAGGAFTALKTALGLSSGALLGIVAGIGALIGAFTYLWNTNENFRNKMSEIWDRISSSVSDVLDKIGSSLMSLWNDILKPFLNFASETLAPVFVYCFEAIGDTALAVLGIFSGLLEFITGVFTLNWEQAWEGVKTIFSSIFDFICSIGQTALDLICDTFRPIADWFNDNVIKPIKNFFSPIADWFNKNVVQPIMNFFSPLFEWFEKLFGNIAETIRSAFDVIGQLAQGCWNIIVACWQIASTWFDNNIAKPIKNTFSDAWSALKQGASDAWLGIKSTFGQVSKFFKDTFTDAWTKVKNVFSTGGKIFDGIKEGIVKSFTYIVNGIIKGINKVIATPFNGINNVLKSIKNVNILGFKPFSGLGTISVPKIPLFAKGGFPDVGQMFIARENGIPEMVGRMGTRNAVANNSQIETGIYNAVMSAIRDAGGMVQRGQGGDLHIIIQDENGRTKIEKIIKDYNDYIRSTGGKGGIII